MLSSLTTCILRARGARHAACALTMIVVGTMAPTAAATTVEPMDMKTQATAADRIFVGTVTAVETRPKAIAPKYLETVVTFAVEDVVVGAGAMPSTAELVFSGGTMGNVRETIEGMPEVEVGERYVVLLEPDHAPPLVSPVVGFNQGLYRVVGESRRSAIVRDRHGIPLVAGRTSRGAEPSLDDFLDALVAARVR